ncbi:thymidylate synthase [Dictyocaulus viviparus]|uniref:Thymidylate synthase n=1 Tax=Dictyocaulus viviparus TaxID=29172 RepID=A0A0D8XIL9_DICVI|nr:thymidylate synthase [Dictyocaulus viviparus]
MQNSDELQYLEQIQEILNKGKPRTDRTNTGTLSIFGMQSRYNIRNGVLPLLTTKRVFWKGIVEELLWFIRGDTDSKRLSAKNVKEPHFISLQIWDANGSREFLDSLGFTDRAEGDLGPVYGFQWRHFGAQYKGPDANYDGEGVDQLAEVIHQIRTAPDSRRIIMTAWNPCDLKIMALPPCHTMCQFYVQDGELSCQLYQRSGDMGLGVPFNIASYSLLTHMVAHTGDFVHTLGDAHIYVNHVEALKIQLQRTPTSFPTIRFGEGIQEIGDFSSDKIFLENYNPQPAIKMDMAL